jgi:hypothetical protein
MAEDWLGNRSVSVLDESDTDTDTESDGLEKEKLDQPSASKS